MLQNIAPRFQFLYPPLSPISNNPSKTTHLQVGLGLGLLHDRVKLGSLHDVTLDLELARHEETLSVGRAIDELAELFFGEQESDY